MYVYHVYAVPTEAKRGTGVADGVSTENDAHVLCKRSTRANSLSIPVAIVNNFTFMFPMQVHAKSCYYV